MLQFELPNLGQPPCFRGDENLQFSWSKCCAGVSFLHMKLRRFRLFFSLLLSRYAGQPFAAAQSSTPPASSAMPKRHIDTPSSTRQRQAARRGRPQPRRFHAGQTQQGDPLKRPLTEKQKKANSKAMKQELSSTYKKWLNEDVRWIITPEELSAFKQLSNDEERDAVHRAVLAAPRPHSRHAGERVQRRALPAHRLCQRTLRRRHSGLEDGPRTHLHRVRSARPDRVTSFRRQLPASDRRGRR